jgi:acetyl esterase
MTQDPYFAALVAIMVREDLKGDISDPALAAACARDAVRPDEYAVAGIELRDDEVTGPRGPVRVRQYDPVERNEARPLIVWCHGGGWVGGELDMPEGHDVALELAARTGCRVVSVEYRLALNGAHYPVPLDDVVAVCRWVAGLLGNRPYVVGGASAGANLAAGAVLRLRDEGRPVPVGLLLAYPLVHPVLPPLSEELAAKAEVLPPLLGFVPEVVAAAVENYLGASADQAETYAMAGLADLAGMPATFIVNAEYDALRASGEAFAAALVAAGVEVELYRQDGVVHGHLNQPWSDGGQATLTTMAMWLAGLPTESAGVDPLAAADRRAAPAQAR